MRKLSAFLTACAAAIAIVPVQASAQSYQADRVVKSVQVADLKAIVTSLGHTVDGEKVAGDYSVRGLTDNGLRYLLIGTACDVQEIAGCQGVMMQVRFSNDTGQPISYEKLNQANFEQAAINAWYSPDSNTLGVTRYVVLDHGLTMANLKANVDVLLSITPQVMDLINE